MKTILITGATGFVGRHLVEHALERGYKVVASVRSSSNISWLNKRNIPIAALSLSDPKKLDLDLKNIVETHGIIDFVIHCAGITQSFNPDDYYHVNYSLTRNLINALQKIEIISPKFIFISSIAAIGPGNPLSLEPIREDDDPHPVTHYGKSKLKAEQFLKDQKELPWVIIRPTVVYGPYEKNFFNMIKAINLGFELYIGSKNQMLSFIYVDDLTDVIIKMCGNNLSKKVYNISDGFVYSATKVNQIVKSVLNRKAISIVIPIWIVRIIAFFTEVSGRIIRRAPILNQDKLNELEQLNWLCDNSALVDEVGFSPKHNFESGIKKTIKWYKENDWL
ncbi:MAG: NAD(P)-dependent oxidoreductase [Bacteroidetes bacterium]|nr:NAD(P)-dependent oxidoreductase [Bacteroidota bacterium]